MYYTLGRVESDGIRPDRNRTALFCKDSESCVLLGLVWVGGWDEYE